MWMEQVMIKWPFHFIELNGQANVRSAKARSPRTIYVISTSNLWATQFGDSWTWRCFKWLLYAEPRLEPILYGRWNATNMRWFPDSLRMSRDACLHPPLRSSNLKCVTVCALCPSHTLLHKQKSTIYLLRPNDKLNHKSIEIPKNSGERKWNSTPTGTRGPQLQRGASGRPRCDLRPAAEALDFWFHSRLHGCGFDIFE